MNDFRFAHVTGFGVTADQVARYLPENYMVVSTVMADGRPYVLIQGRDRNGWTLDGYVIPRLASGLLWAEEVKR